MTQKRFAACNGTGSSGPLDDKPALLFLALRKAQHRDAIPCGLVFRLPVLSCE